MSKHRKVICDICDSPITGEYVRIRVRNTAAVRPFRYRKYAIDVCDACWSVMFDSVVTTEENDAEDMIYG